MARATLNENVVVGAEVFIYAAYAGPARKPLQRANTIRTLAPLDNVRSSAAAALVMSIAK